MKGLALWLLVFTAGAAHAQVAAGQWHLSGDPQLYRVEVAGGAELRGAAITLQGTGSERGSGAASRVIDAATYRNSVLTLSARVTADEVSGGAGIWLRASADGRPPAFANSQRQPVRGTAADVERQISIVVPRDATRISFGPLLNGSGRTTVTGWVLDSRPCSANPAVTPERVLAAAVDAVKRSALNAGRVDWVTVEPKARAMLGDSTCPEAAYPAVRMVLAALGDRHSRLLEPAARREMVSTATATSEPAITVSDNVGYVLLPGFRGAEGGAATALARGVRERLGALAPEARCGWVVDLRRNSGGNVFPMLAALKPLLGDGELGVYEDRNGRRQPWHASGPALARNEDQSSRAVAVLLGPRTASSGEAIAIAFRGRADTRSFGLPTAGLSTGNGIVDLPDGSRIMLTEGVAIDRRGQRYGGVVTPDTTVDGAADADSALQAARRWLDAQCVEAP
ncbi:S41 family peptidase [Lysobacter korlensis]|uniref:S41 family peptidase n=1 Tax=Lysobacter korlensis TaxID=553636 RepID=A0ABV6RK15_9GAMM